MPYTTVLKTRKCPRSHKFSYHYLTFKAMPGRPYTTITVRTENPILRAISQKKPTILVANIYPRLLTWDAGQSTKALSLLSKYAPIEPISNIQAIEFFASWNSWKEELTATLRDTFSEGSFCELGNTSSSVVRLK